jgi:hypothetical protein
VIGYYCFDAYICVNCGYTAQFAKTLAGDIQLDGLADESGNAQSFRAGFQCGW